MVGLYYLQMTDAVTTEYEDCEYAIPYRSVVRTKEKKIKTIPQLNNDY